MPLFVVCCVAVPALELWVLWQVADLVGWPLALLALVALSAVGYRLMRARGVVSLRRLRTALRQSRVPGQALVDGALDELAALAIAVPGFVTAFIGLLLSVPQLRAASGRATVWWMGRRAEAGRAPRRDRERVTASVAAVAHGYPNVAHDDELLDAFVAGSADLSGGEPDPFLADETPPEQATSDESALPVESIQVESIQVESIQVEFDVADAPAAAGAALPADDGTGADAWASFGTDRPWEEAPRRFRRRRSSRRGGRDESDDGGVPT